MKWLRSAEMEYISLIVNEDVAHDCIQQLGDLGVIQFTDLNTSLTPFQRRYVSYVKRCDEMERKLRYFEAEMTKFHIPLDPTSVLGNVEGFLQSSSDMRYRSQDVAMKALDTLEHVLEEKEIELQQLNLMHDQLTKEYTEKKELQQVIAKTSEFFSIDVTELLHHGPNFTQNHSMSRDDHTLESDPPESRLLNLASSSSSSSSRDVTNAVTTSDLLRFRSLTGIVSLDERLKFERLIFRTTRGNCYTRFSVVSRSSLSENVDEEDLDEEQDQVVFVLFFQSETIETKLRKICDAFHARLYSLPSMEDVLVLSELMHVNALELSQSRHILRRNRESCVLLCQELREHVESWKWTVIQEKATYHTLNGFKTDVAKGMLRGEGWVIASALDAVKAKVSKAHSMGHMTLPHLVNPSHPTALGGKAGHHSVMLQPPTYFEVNKFTASFQDFVDTYGIPRYGEINPAVFTAITFPFLFGVMYGDIGHGSCLFSAGLYLILTEHRLVSDAQMGEMTRQIYGGRYMIAMMGAFGVYAGLIYNDFFALSLNLFGSTYDYGACFGARDCIAAHEPQRVYAFGLDPVWKTSTNELVFFNSFKMKFSVVIGVIQMSFGILLKGANAMYFRNWIDLLLEFIPQLVFCLALFGYMVVLIVWKWTIRWHFGNSDPRTETDSSESLQPPALINTLINIVLNPTEVEEELYVNQLAVQQLLLLCALISVPIMLLGKPLVEHWFSGPTKIIIAHASDESEDELIEEEEHGLSELMIHQGIETIEFVLGMVSNTASYLRLWALSLAHSELALVFWTKAMLVAINTGNPIYVFIGFAVFAAVTTGVLLLMDVLECFLHALRLHWVEFQNKFYKADGYKFDPFSFEQLLKTQAMTS